jgi:hypothetical protein
VQQPDADDWKKLACVMKYLRRTKNLKLTMEATHLDQNHWFIDGAFAVHEDMKSHTGSYMTFERGMMDGSCTKYKINTTSSTQAEVVAVHDNMPSILWTRYFLEAQGTRISHATLRDTPRQSERNASRGKWEGLKQQTNTSHEHSILFCGQLPATKSSYTHLLSDRQDDW